MASQIRILAQCYDNDSGDILEEVVINDTQVQKAKTLRDLGYLHKDQIEILQKAQDLKLKHQLMLATPEKCQKCGNKMSKRGMFGTKFHAVLTDHKVKLQYMRCKCGWLVLVA
jgi:predicted Zn-ribbon and HTH transcriptional regulator